MIKTQALSKTFQIGKKHDVDLKAVDALTLEVHEGEVFGFLGPNGAGKTTTVRMLTSLIRPTSGTAQVAGYQVGVDDVEIRRNVGLLTESPGMYERLSAEKNLRIFAELYDVPDVNKSVNKYLSLFGLWDRRMDAVGSFSKGMRQKLAVARALVHEPQVLFFDEPTTGLHFEDVRKLLEVLHALVDAGNTVVVIEHQLDVIAHADWVIDLGPGAGADGGRIVACGTPETIAHHPDSATGRYLAGRLAQG